MLSTEGFCITNRRLTQLKPLFLVHLLIISAAALVLSFSIGAEAVYPQVVTYSRITTPAAPSACGFPLSPICVRTAYGFTSLTADGTGVTVAIVDAFGDPTLTKDLSSFDGKFGLAAPTLTVINVDGAPGTNSGWALETALDVEWAHAIAPKASIRLYVGLDNSFQHLLNAINRAVSDNVASVISMSFGASENSFSTSGFLTLYESAFSTAVNKGITPVASSGDNGKVGYPSSSPNVVSVGGTTLTISSTGAYVSEKTWNNRFGSTGGGSSRVFSEPSYQLGVPENDAARTRGTPDVAYDGDPVSGFDVFCSSCGGEFQVGGTSAGAPQWAALIALRVQSKGRLGLGNNSIYSIGKGASYSSNFHDVTAGQVGSKKADAAWDYTTGWGSPRANNLVPNL